MPVHKKEHTTPETKPRTPESSTPSMPAPEEFHEYLRAQIRDATRVVMEEVMREELQRFVGAAWGEHTPERKGYRNGFYTRDLATTSGPIEDLKVPRDREGEFHTQSFERYSRYEPQVADGLTQMFVSGTSTRYQSERWLRHSWEWLPVPVRSVASTKRSPNNLKSGENVHF